MGNILTPELQKQIIKEANSSAANFHYYPGSEQFEDMGSAYESGAFKYAEKWQVEKGLRERYEKVLKAHKETYDALAKEAERKYTEAYENDTKPVAATLMYNMLHKAYTEASRRANETLTPKTSTDDTDNG